MHHLFSCKVKEDIESLPKIWQYFFTINGNAFIIIIIIIIIIFILQFVELPFLSSKFKSRNSQVLKERKCVFLFKMKQNKVKKINQQNQNKTKANRKKSKQTKNKNKKCIQGHARTPHLRQKI